MRMYYFSSYKQEWEHSVGSGNSKGSATGRKLYVIFRSQRKTSRDSENTRKRRVFIGQLQCLVHLNIFLTFLFIGLSTPESYVHFAPFSDKSVRTYVHTVFLVLLSRMYLVFIQCFFTVPLPSLSTSTLIPATFIFLFSWQDIQPRSQNSTPFDKSI